MLTRDLQVINESGIHARPAAAIVEVVGKYASDVHFLKDDVRANAKSIMNIMLLAAEPGASIRVEVDGPDEADAMEAVIRLFENKFYHE